MTAIHRVGERVFRPWKNGGGQTAEIMASPDGATIDAFDWRLSTAVVAADGPFSMFEGVTRVLTVVEGGPMSLMIDGVAHELEASSPPLRFDGGAAAYAKLKGGPLLDFNVMCQTALEPQVSRGPLRIDEAPMIALLLEDHAPFQRLDCIDFREAPELVDTLEGCLAISVCFR